MIASGKISEAVQLAPAGDTVLAVTRSRPLSPVGAEALNPQAQAYVLPEEPVLRRTMLLLQRSHRATNAVRPVAPGGRQVVAWVGICICMILAALGDALDPAWIGEAGLEVAMFDLAGEFSVLTMQHWHLRLLLGGAALAAGIAVLRIGGTGFDRALRPTPPRGVEKVPIKL